MSSITQLSLFLQNEAGSLNKACQVLAKNNIDIITLSLPMTVEKVALEGQGVYFQRGPLLYAYTIPQKMEEDLTDYENMHGKKPENADFKCWNIIPTGSFNY